MENVKFCPHCGARVHAEAVVCVSCGRNLPPKRAADDVNSRGLNALSFFFPFVGLILYLVNMNTAPIKARGIGKWALIGFITGFVCSILCSVITGCAVMMEIMNSSYYY